MAITRRTFAQTVLAAGALALWPAKRMAQRVVLRVRYAEKPRSSQCRGKSAPLSTEEITRTGKWLG